MAEASQAKPIEDVRDISATTYGFMASKALFAALDKFRFPDHEMERPEPRVRLCQIERGGRIAVDRRSVDQLGSACS
jgi:hypothetical protein